MYDQVLHNSEYTSGIRKLADQLQVDHSQLELNQDSSQNIFVEFKVIRPGVFTSGLIPGLTELTPVEMIGALDLRDSSFAVSGFIPHLRYRQYAFDSTQLAAARWNNRLLGSIDINHATLFDNIEVQDLLLKGVRQSADTTLIIVMQQDSLNNPDSAQDLRFLLSAVVSQQDTGLIFYLNEAPIINYDTSWTIDPLNRIVLTSNSIDVRNFVLYKGEQKISGSELDEKTLRISIEDLDLETISNTVKWQSDYAHGLLNGEIDIIDPLGAMALQTNLRFSEFGSRRADLGEMEITGIMDSEGNWEITSSLSGEMNDLEITGRYGSEEGSLEGLVKGNLSNLPTFVQFVPEHIDSADGSIDIDLRIEGTTRDPELNGYIELANVYFKPRATGSPWLIPLARLSFSPELIALTSPVAIVDSFGNRGTLTLEVVPYDISDYGLRGNFRADNFLMLHIPENDKDLYSGTVLADIAIDISGSTSDAIRIKGGITPREGSSLVYLYDSGDELQALETGDGIIEFIDFYAVDSLNIFRNTFQKVLSRQADYVVNLTANINHNLDLKMIVDRSNGDHLTGQGDGTLSMRMAPGEDIVATGQLDVSGSKYHFTYEGLIKREFVLEEDSYLTFTGRVDNPTLDLKAQYNVKTSPELLVRTYGSPSESDYDRLKRRQEFVADINVRGEFEDVEFSSDIQYPDVSGNSIPDLVEPALTKLRSIPSDMNTQAFSLIIFNGFSLGGSTSGSLVNVSQEVGDVVSGQLNSLASRYVNFVELDFGIENLSESALNFDDTDFRVGVKKRFLDDRLVVEIDGVASTRSGSGSDMASVLENVSAEYVLNKSRSLRIKAFNTYETDEIIAGRVLKIGAALLISRDFDSLIFKRQEEVPGADKSGKEQENRQ